MSRFYLGSSHQTPANVDLPLFDRFARPSSPFCPTSDTSHAAAVAIENKTAMRRREVWKALVKAGANGLTRQELEPATCLSGDSIRPRVLELIASGHVIESQVQTRLTRAGNAAAVLLATGKVL